MHKQSTQTYNHEGIDLRPYISISCKQSYIYTTYTYKESNQIQLIPKQAIITKLQSIKE